MSKAIVIGGTPGTGKTTIARRLAKITGYRHIDVSAFVIENKLYRDYDAHHLSYVIDEEKVVNELKRIISSGKVIIDTHYPEIIPPDLVEIVIILRARPSILEARLRERGWPWHKIRENVMAEIMSVPTVNAIEAFGRDKVYEVDTSEKTIDETLSEIIGIIKGERKPEPGLRYDWLALLPLEEIMKYER